MVDKTEEDGERRVLSEHRLSVLETTLAAVDRRVTELALRSQEHSTALTTGLARAEHIAEQITKLGSDSALSHSALARQMEVMHQENNARETRILDRIEQHDLRDDTNFSGVNARLTTLEAHHSIREGERGLVQMRQSMIISAVVGGSFALVQIVWHVFGGK